MSIVTNPNPAKENSVSFNCPILTPTNYNTWSIKMEAIMDAHRLWDNIGEIFFCFFILSMVFLVTIKTQENKKYIFTG
ncbi:hypothetical protein HanIR_Chr07g0305471 [Helianthus annuus]|nr:hypothetical protein HanIR_Chr07g0305471 [Helianthus annuus]